MIERKLVPENRRLSFLPKHCGKPHYMQYEMAVYSMARRLCAEYDGGFWNYYELSNGGWYMGLDDDRTFHVACPGNYYEGDMSADAFGVTACLYAYNAMFGMGRASDEVFSDAYYALRDYAAEHAEREHILAAID